MNFLGTFTIDLNSVIDDFRIKLLICYSSTSIVIWIILDVDKYFSIFINTNSLLHWSNFIRFIVYFLYSNIKIILFVYWIKVNIYQIWVIRKLYYECYKIFKIDAVIWYYIIVVFNLLILIIWSIIYNSYLLLLRLIC